MATGYHDFTPGETLTAANLEDFCMRQSVMIFASASARNTALSAVLQEGMFAYLQDVNVLTVYSGAAWSTIGPVHGAWTTWVPTITQVGTVAATVVRSSHIRFGRMMQTDGVLSVTGTGTSSSLITLTLPVTASSSNANTLLGRGLIFDSSAAAYYKGDWVLNSATTAKLHIDSGLYAGTSIFTAALASGDTVAFQWNYEAASDA